MFIKRFLSITWKIIAVVLALLFFINKFYFAPVPVEHYVVETGSITAQVMGTGTLEARISAIISAKISGRISDILVDQGDYVSKGRLLAKLDDRDLKAQVEVAQAELGAAIAGVDRAEADIVSSKAVALNARTFYNRKVLLAKEQVASEEDLDNATQQRDVAEAQLHRAELAKIEMERLVLKAEKSLMYYQEKMADTQIYAPFDGLIIGRDIDPGTVIVPGSSILQIISTDQMWISAWVDESVVSQVAVDQPACIVFRSEPEKSYKGSVARISPLADRETREFQVDVLVKELPSVWAVGQRAEVYIMVANKDDVLLVPQHTILWRNGKSGLYIMNNEGKAQWRNIELGLRGEKLVEVVSGVNNNDVVIKPSDPKKSLNENRSVRLK